MRGRSTRLPFRAQTSAALLAVPQSGPVLLPAPRVATTASMLGKKGDAELRPVQDGAPPRHATWPTASQLIIADVIGIGVMAMAEAFAELGWVLGVACCVLMLLRWHALLSQSAARRSSGEAHR